jgi:hypothetical protein
MIMLDLLLSFLSHAFTDWGWLAFPGAAAAAAAIFTGLVPGGTLIRWGIPALIAIAVYGFGSSFVTEYKNAVRGKTLADIEVRKITARYESEKRMRDRRDEAIAASKCAAQIKDWIRNPDKIPKPFDPFKNGPLSPPN